MVFSALSTERHNQEDLRTDTRRPHRYEYKETCAYFIPSFTSSTIANFNDYIFESSSEEADDYA